MEYVIGLALSLAASGLAVVVGLDRDRAFYATVMIWIAANYVLFAAMAASERTIVVEVLAASVFLMLAITGFKRNLWLVALGLVGHGVFDFVHHLIIENPGVPRWWPGFCLIFDLVLGGLLAVRLTRSGVAGR